MPSLQVHILSLKAGQVRRVPPPVRSFLFIISHALNEMNFLYRCIMALDNETGIFRGHEREVIWHQNLFFLRLHYSKACEAWRVYRSYKRHLCKYEDQVNLDQAAHEAKAKLDVYFSKKDNFAKKIRNGFGFHYPSDGISNYPMRSFDDDDDFSFIFHKQRGNCHYSFADFIAFKSMEKALFGDIDDSVQQDHITNCSKII